MPAQLACKYGLHLPEWRSDCARKAGYCLKGFILGGLINMQEIGMCDI